MDDQYHLLGLGSAASIIIGIELAEPGQRVLVRGLYDPKARRPFEMVFTRCREVHLEYLSDEPRPEAGLETPLIGISLGEERHRSPAIITTDAFELSILYDEFRVAKPDRDSKPAGSKSPVGR
jgi:hypothetical protein